MERKLASAEPPYVVAGVMHYGITDVHPFADGNGRAARLFQAALLMRAGVLPGRMFSFERFYAEDRDSYYSALRSVRERTFNLEHWLHYFLRGLVDEYERVATTVEDLGSFMPGGEAGPLQLRPTQQRALTALRIQGRTEFARREYEDAAGLGKSAAGGDLRELVRHGVLRIRGSGPTTRYVFVASAKGGQEAFGPRAPRIWTDSVIEQELRALVASRGSWPSYSDFVQLGRRDLYAAASRSGGIRRWRTILGM